MPVLSNKLYNALKVTVTLILPGLAALYAALSTIWGFPAPLKVDGTVAALNVFLGGLLHLSTATYNVSNKKYDGTMQVTTKADGTKTHDLILWNDPETLADQKAVSFKVESSTAPATDPQTYPPTP